MLCSRSKIKHKIVEDPALIGMKEKNHYLMTTKQKKPKKPNTTKKSLWLYSDQKMRKLFDDPIQNVFDKLIEINLQKKIWATFDSTKFQ